MRVPALKLYSIKPKQTDFVPVASGLSKFIIACSLVAGLYAALYLVWIQRHRQVGLWIFVYPRHAAALAVQYTFAADPGSKILRGKYERVEPRAKGTRLIGVFFSWKHSLWYSCDVNKLNPNGALIVFRLMREAVTPLYCTMTINQHRERQ